MLIRLVKSSLLGLCTFALSCGILQAASFITDFNSGLPPGTSVAGNAFWSSVNGVGDSGAVKLVIPVVNVGQSGGFVVPDFAGGVAVTNFRAKFKLLVGGGTDRPADGMSVSFGNSANALPGEEGTGIGIAVCLDTWDNQTSGDPNDTAPSIDIKWNGGVIASQSTDGVRQDGRPPAGPILTNSAGAPVSIETVGPNSSGAPLTTYVDVIIELAGDNTISLSYSNVIVYNHLPIPYSPISGGSWIFAARTGGANDNFWIDNVEILANFHEGPATITQFPQNQTVTESQTATFSAQFDGTPPLTIQWFSNNVAIAGANQPSYTTPPTTLAMNGTLYRVQVSNAETAPVSSEDVTLFVNSGVLLQNVSTRLHTNHIFLTYNKPVNLTGTYSLDHGATVDSLAYGASHSEIILITTPLAAGTTYTLTASGVTGEDLSSLIPDPTVVSFIQGVGGICTDFAGALPANTALKGSAATNADGSIHLTEALNNQGGGLLYSGYAAGSSIDRFNATFKAFVGNTAVIGSGADGLSFNIASDIPVNETGLCDPYCAEGGVGSGFTVTIDTWDDGSLNDPSIDVIWHGQVVGHRYFDRPHGEQLERDHFVPVAISLDPSGKVNVSYDGIAIFTDLQLPNFDQINNPKLGIYGRTGGLNENHYIDDLCVTHNYTLGPLFIVTEPADATLTETFRATFGVVLDGSPAYNIQWYSNDVAIAGANGLTYTTPPTTVSANGARYHAVISNGQGTVTTRDAVLTVNAAVVVASATATSPTAVTVSYSKAVTLAGTYSISGGITGTPAYGANHSEVLLTLSSPLAGDTSYTLTIAGVIGEDSSTLVPDPTLKSLRFGYGKYCTDFSVANSTTPPGTRLYGDGVSSGYISNGVLHLTDAPVGSLSGAFVISNRTDGLPLDRVYATWRMRINGGADGVSFNWGNDVFGPSSEEGLGTGLTVVFDTYPNVATEPRFAIKWKGAQIATTGPVPNSALSKGTFVDVAVALDPDGTVDLFYDNVQIFNNVQLPNYAPIANSGFSFAGRTGGVSEDAWIDDLCINSFTPGPIRFLAEPVDTTVGETLPATFTTVVDGDPTYRYQWFTNGVAVVGARSSTYTIASATEAMNGLHVSVLASNATTMVTSSNATLTVTLNPRVASVVACAANKIVVAYTRPVALDYPEGGAYDISNPPGAPFESFREYATADHRQVAITLDGNLNPNTTYELTISGAQNEAQTLPINPDPTVRAFRFSGAYTPKVADFNIPNAPPNSAIGNDMTLYGTAYLQNGVVHITDALNDQHGSLVVTNVNNGAPTDRFVVRYRAVLSGAASNPSAPFGGGNPADGYSLNIATDIPLGTIANLAEEEGAGSGLTVSFDNWDNNNGGNLTGLPNAEAPAIDVKWNGVIIRSTTDTTKPDTYKSPATIAAIMRTPNPTTFRDVYIDLEPDGKIYVEYGGTIIYNGLQTPFNGMNGGMANARVGIYGRTGGANENVWIDDLQINAESLGAPTIAREPADTTVPELGTASFIAIVDGLPPFSYQWYSNNVAIPGANGSGYTTPTVYRTMEGTTYKLVVTSACGSATSRDAVLHVSLDNVAPYPFWISVDNTRTTLLLFFSEALNLASGTNGANYSVNNGGAVTSASYVAGTGNRYVALTVSPALNPVNCNVLTINGVNDLTGYNPANARYPIVVSPGFPTSGANNLVVIEAEDYDVNRSPGLSMLNTRWYLSDTNLPGITTVGTFVGRGYMNSDNLGTGSGSDPVGLAAGTSIDYAVNFATAGTYYVWARGSTANDGGNNSFHLNVDNVSQGTSSRQIGNATQNWGADGGAVNKFGWVSDANAVAATRATISIASPGVHVLTVVMREDGLKLDRFLLTTDVSFSPGAVNDPGPAATVKPGVALSLVRDAGGNATISWPGASWTLQGTTALSNNPAQTIWQNVPYPSGTVIPAGYFGTGPTNVIFRLICK